MRCDIKSRLFIKQIPLPRGEEMKPGNTRYLLLGEMREDMAARFKKLACSLNKSGKSLVIRRTQGVSLDSGEGGITQSCCSSALVMKVRRFLDDIKICSWSSSSSPNQR